MKIGGWTLIGMGVFAILIFLEKAFVEGDLRLRLLIIGPGAILVGWSFLARAKNLAEGIVTGPEPAAPSATMAAGNARGPEVSAATIELPLSRSAAEVLGAWPRKNLLQMSVVVPLIFAVFVVPGAIFAHAKSSDLSFKEALVFFSALGGGIVLIFLFGWAFGIWLPARRDLREAKYLRTRGPIAVERRQKGGYILRMADRGLLASKFIGNAIEKRGVNWAVVDYSRHGQVILGVWDQEGKVVFLEEGYSADPPPTVSKADATAPPV